MNPTLCTRIEVQVDPFSGEVLFILPKKVTNGDYVEELRLLNEVLTSTYSHSYESTSGFLCIKRRVS